MKADTIATCIEVLEEVKSLARTLDQVKHHRGTYYQDKIVRIDTALAELTQPQPPQEA